MVASMCRNDLNGTIIIYVIKKILPSMSSAKATGEDGVCVRLMILNIGMISMMLAHIINLSIATLKVPTQWKSAVVKPLFKSGDRSNVSNYRPISILPACSKILEKIIHTQVYEFLSMHNILSKA